MSNTIIAAGDISIEAEQFLVDHGARLLYTESFMSLIELPETAHVEKNGYEWRYAIHFGETEDDEGNFPPYCEMELYANAADTRIVLKEG
jgi:hypothetical protein